MSYYPPQAGYEHKRFLLHVSEKLTQNESNKIVYVEDLPQNLENATPLKVFAHLEMLGKTSPDELTRILNSIKRYDLAKKVKEGKPRKNQLTRKDSGSSSLKLDESLTLAIKNCEILLEQLEYLKIGASKVGRKRMEEVITDAKENLKTQTHRKLKYISGLLASECCEDNERDSPQSSPENSLTSLRSPTPRSDSPPSPVGPGATGISIKMSELRRAHENLKSTKQRSTVMQQSMSGGATSTNEPHPSSSRKPATAAHNQVTMTIVSQPVDSNEEENIYTVPMASTSVHVPSPVSKVDTERKYYNITTQTRHDVGPVSSSASSDRPESEATSLVTGSSKGNKKIAPTPPPKPKSFKKQLTGSVESPGDASLPSDDTMTGDSGFSDSREFLKDPPPASHQQVPAQHEPLTDSEPGYASLIKSDVRPPGYYKSTTKHENIIPEVVYEDA